MNKPLDSASAFEPVRMVLEPHQLDRPLAALRVPDPGSMRALQRSLEQAGQLNPCVVVQRPGDAGNGGDLARHILIDGYRRVAALGRLRHDTVWVECWTCSFTEALARMLAGSVSRACAPLEEALMLRELAQAGQLSQHTLARRIGRDVSWVSRRLALLDSISDELLGAVCAGQVSVWAATRVLAPLARANTAHASTLLGALRQTPMSTRQLSHWYRHYTGSPRATRERLVAQPHLYARAQAHAVQARDDQRLRDGPEGEWAQALARIHAQLTRLRRALAVLVSDEDLVAELRPALERVHDASTRLQQDIDRHALVHLAGAARERAHDARPRRTAAPDKPSAQALAQHRAPHPQGAAADSGPG